MNSNGTTTLTDVPSLRDRLKARHAGNGDPLAAIRSYDDLPSVLTAPATKPQAARVAVAEPAPVGETDTVSDIDDSDASALYEGLDLAFDPARLSWLTPSRGNNTTDRYLTLSRDLSAVRISKGTRNELGEAEHVQVAFATDGMIVLRITRTAKDNKYAIKVKPDGMIGARWLANELAAHGWKQGRYRVDRAAPDYLTCRLKDRIGDCPVGGRVKAV